MCPRKLFTFASGVGTPGQLLQLMPNGVESNINKKNKNGGRKTEKDGKSISTTRQKLYRNALQ
jgi:hypothetical protein